MDSQLLKPGAGVPMAAGDSTEMKKYIDLKFEDL
jgi:hypothetical protein